MTRSLLLTGLRDLIRRPLHTGLMILGVALGVAVVVSIDLANSAARSGPTPINATSIGHFAMSPPNRAHSAWQSPVAST